MKTKCNGHIQGDDGLHPIAKLEKFAASENIFNRQMVARTVLETLRQVEKKLRGD